VLHQSDLCLCLCSALYSAHLCLLCCLL
jgi:hypothetical protein